MTTIDALNALASALLTLAEGLDATIADLDGQGASGQARCTAVERAQGQLESAASQINDAAARATFAAADVTALQALTAQISARASAIARDEQNVARIAGIGRGVLTLATDLAGGNLAGAVASASDVENLLG